MNKNRESWSDLDLKTRIAYITAIVAFVIGWCITIAGFFVDPLGIISDSVLWVLGQALVYAASVFGVGMYVTNSVRAMKHDIRRFMLNEDRMYRHEEPIEEEEVLEDGEQVL